MQSSQFIPAGYFLWRGWMIVGQVDWRKMVKSGGKGPRFGARSTGES
jgi:hypothetical protein